MKVPAKTEAEERAEKMRLALSASTAEATPKLGVSAVLSPAAQPAAEPKKYRLSGWDVNTGRAMVTPAEVKEIEALSKMGLR